eukprot:238029_1
MDITLQIYHHHHMSDKEHDLNVRIKSINSILELKEAIASQYPNKAKYFIAPPSFQTLIFHGKILADHQLVQELFASSPIQSNQLFPSDVRQGNIILLQWPRTDAHLRQIRNVITDPSKDIDPFSLSQGLSLSMARVMKVIQFLEACGFVQVESSPNSRRGSLRTSSMTLDVIDEQQEELMDHRVGAMNHLQSPRSSGRFMNRSHSAPDLFAPRSIRPLLHTEAADLRTRTFSSEEMDTEDGLLAASLFRVIANELAEALGFNSDEESEGPSIEFVEDDDDE